MDFKEIDRIIIDASEAVTSMVEVVKYDATALELAIETSKNGVRIAEKLYPSLSSKEEAAAAILALWEVGVELSGIAMRALMSSSTSFDANFSEQDELYLVMLSESTVAAIALLFVAEKFSLINDDDKIDLTNLP